MKMRIVVSEINQNKENLSTEKDFVSSLLYVSLSREGKKQLDAPIFNLTL